MGTVRAVHQKLRIAMRYSVFLIVVSILLAGFPCAFASVANADSTDSMTLNPLIEAAAESGPIAEKAIAPGPKDVAPAPSSTSGGSLPKTEASPSPGTPAAAASPSAPITGSRLGAIFQPDQWQWPHKFTLTNPDTWPFIPVPEVATDPNGGTTVGILAAVLYTDSKNQITDIFAPDVETNTTLGPGGTFRFLSYPSEDTNWYAVAGAQEKIARRVDVDYQTGRTRKEWWSFEGRFYWEKDPTERFFGVGNGSRLGNETNYTTNQLYGLAVLGLNFTQDLQLALSVRPRRVRIQNGGFNSVPSIFQLFPTQKGIDGGSEVVNQAVFSYDTRDSLQVPRKGGLALAYFAIADRRFGSSISYTRFGGELRRFYAINEKVTLAGHLFAEYNP